MDNILCRIRLRSEGILIPEAEKFWEPKPYEELYDLRSDPHELSNLAEDRQYQGSIKEIREVLYKWIIETREYGTGLVYPMFIGFALDQTYLNCGLELPELLNV